jgi:hypothetical protein
MPQFHFLYLDPFHGFNRDPEIIKFHNIPNLWDAAKAIQDEPGQSLVITIGDIKIQLFVNV